MLVIYGFLTGGIAIFMLYLRYCIKRDKKLPWNRMLQNKIYPIMKKLYSAKEAFENSRKFCEQKIKLCLFIVGIGCLSAFFYEIFLLNTQQLKEGCLIRRNAYGEGNRQVWLWVVTEESGKHEKLKLLIPERAYTEEELADLFKQVPSDLINEILGDNSSLNNVSKELDLVTSLEGYPFQISWSSDSPYLLSESGKIDENRLKEMENAEEGILISLTAELSYEEFTEFLDLYARVYPQPKSDEEQFL
ncbi:MAG TPA: hypothetical protein PLU43_08075, partial [Lachnospiraceae bacterium]|nr:hypothetical protein [Lachnospiraceae bacterium]